MGNRKKTGLYDYYSLLDIFSDSAGLKKVGNANNKIENKPQEPPPEKIPITSFEVIKAKIWKLYRLYEEIYFLMRFVLKKQKQILNEKITIFYEDGLAELKETWFLPIDERIKAHEDLLKILKRY